MAYHCRTEHLQVQCPETNIKRAPQLWPKFTLAVKSIIKLFILHLYIRILADLIPKDIWFVCQNLPLHQHWQQCSINNNLTLHQRICIHSLLMMTSSFPCNPAVSWAVSIPWREHAFLYCGEFIVLREHPAIDADVDGEPAMLHAKVGQLLFISPIRNSQRILMSLLVLASGFPIARIREGAAPPDRQQSVEYLHTLWWATSLHDFLAAILSAKLLFLLRRT
jgi:hypothetical protein